MKNMIFCLETSLDKLLNLADFLNEQIDNDDMTIDEIKEHVIDQCERFGWKYFFTSKENNDNTIVYDPSSKRKIVYDEESFEYIIIKEKHVYYNRFNDSLIESDEELID